MWKRLIWFLTAVAFTVPGNVSAQDAGGAPPFTADEIAIYRDFLLHYPESLSNLIGMEDTTASFVAPMAFGDEPHPPEVNIPAHTGRQLPPEVMELTDEAAVTARIAATVISGKEASTLCKLGRPIAGP